MRIVHISQQDDESGGFKAAYRLHTALTRAGHDSRMVVLAKTARNPSVTPVAWPLLLTKILASAGMCERCRDPGIPQAAALRMDWTPLPGGHAIHGPQAPAGRGSSASIRLPADVPRGRQGRRAGDWVQAGRRRMKNERK